MALQLGIILSLGCAALTSLAFLFKHRGAVSAPAVDARHPLRSAAGLLRQRWFALGMGVALVAWAMHVAAIAIAPLSLVQAVLAGGLVWLAVLAERLFGHRIGPRQWAGIAMTAVGLAMLTLTVPHAPAAVTYSTLAMVAFEGALALIGIGLLLGTRLGVTAPNQGALALAAVAGLAFGLSDLAIKALTQVGGLPVSPWLPVALIGGFAAFLSSARSLQLGEPVGVVTVTAAGANLSTIAGGILVFGDPVAGDPLAAIGQLAAFALVIAAATLMPAPLRAAHTV